MIKLFEVSFIDTDLFVRARISDVSTGVAVYVADAVMLEDQDGTYYGTYDFNPAKLYLVQPRVYTDGTYGTVDDQYSAASISINPEFQTGVEDGSEIIGIVDDVEEIIGTVYEGE